MGIRTEYGNKYCTGVRSVIYLAFIGLIVACSGNEQSAPPVSRSIIADVIVSVDNQTRNPLSIHVGAGSVTESLGVVSGRSVKSFAMPSGLGTPASLIQLEARGRKGRSNVRSASFTLSSGHRLIWTLDRTKNGTVTIR